MKPVHATINHEMVFKKRIFEEDENYPPIDLLELLTPDVINRIKSNGKYINQASKDHFAISASYNLKIKLEKEIKMSHNFIVSENNR